MAISDRMMACDMGKILQIDTPESLYNKPSNRFVHNFLGESGFINVTIQNGKAYPKGHMDQALDLQVPAANLSDIHPSLQNRKHPPRILPSVH